MNRTEEPGIFSHTITVAKPHIDANGHVNNVVYVQWMQDVAYAHSEFEGYDGAKLAAMDSTWIIRSHSVHYRRPAFLGDTLRVYTWVHSAKRASALRRYKFVRESDGALIANGESDWVYLDRNTGRPRHIEDEIKRVFPEIPQEREP